MALDYRLHLAKDKKLGKYIEGHDRFTLRRRKNICIYLCASIMSQQLSSKVADVIYKRFLVLYNGTEPTPQQIADTPIATLRGIGLSNAKAQYVHNVAQFAIEQGLDEKKLHKMNNDEVIAYLTSIKGVGKWTAEMLLMFALGRPDVFSIDDLGLRNAMIKIYKLDDSDKRQLCQRLLEIAQKWSPYRTYACLHLWHWKDNTPVK